MKASTVFRPSVVACLLAALAVGGLVACASSDETQAERGGEEPGSGSIVVGLTELADGRVEVTGYLDFIELEGGFWAIVETDPRESEDPSVIMILANASEVGLPSPGSPETTDFVGLAVRAVGERFEGASVRMAGPEMAAESLVIADDLGALEEPDEL